MGVVNSVSSGFGVASAFVGTTKGYQSAAFLFERIFRFGGVIAEYTNSKSISGSFGTLVQGLGSLQLSLNAPNLFKDVKRITSGEYFAVSGNWADKVLSYFRQVTQTVGNLGVPFKLLQERGVFKTEGVAGDALALVHDYALLVLNGLNIVHYSVALSRKQEGVSWTNVISSVLKTATLATDKFAPKSLPVVPASVGLVSAGFDLFAFNRKGFEDLMKDLLDDGQLNGSAGVAPVGAVKED